MNLKSQYFPVIFLLIMFAVTGISSPQNACAKTNVANIADVGYNVDISMTDNLKSFTGKRIYVTLSSGKVFSGVVKAIGKKMIHLEKLDGKDFFDALIKIEDISAIDTRFREYERK